MKLVKTLALGALISVSSIASAQKVGMYLGYDSPAAANAQEKAAAEWFLSAFPDGVLITPADASKINSSELSALWLHIDRVGCGMGYDNLPAEYKAALPEIKTFVENGGGLYLSKFATQMVAPLGRIPSEYQPGIFGDGDGGAGTDVWCVNALLGSWQLNPDNSNPDPSQVYDRRDHAIYGGLDSFAAWSDKNNCPHDAFPLEGTADGSEMHREDHNCMWDLNSYSFTADGANTLEQFEKQFDCTVVGTWGHVQDYCVAGIVDFEPTAAISGRILANGLAACEWAPRSGVNAYHSNLEYLTQNALSYLAYTAATGVAGVEAAADEAPVYYNLAGVKVANPSAGLYIKVAAGKASKVMVK